MSDLPLAERGPGEILAFLSEKRRELDELDGQLQDAHNLAGDCEERWTEHLDEIMGQLIEEAKSGRLPGEDVRLSIARQRGGQEAWANFRRSQRTLKRLDGRVALINRQLSAAQSEARLLGVAGSF